ncbi:hypothetical protein N7465_010739 [Penicillium sp. CMV-2018d]|nr:hypothetical protein N7465_010739 [Penicillium sp. CMV-2018d]
MGQGDQLSEVIGGYPYCRYHNTPLSVALISSAHRLVSELDPGQLPGLNCPGLFVTIKHDLQVTLVRYVTPIKWVVNPATNHYIQLNSDCSNTSLSHVYIFSYARLTRSMVNI